MTPQEQPPNKKYLTLSEPETTSSRSKRELIGNFLSNLAQPSIYNRELNERDFELWEGLLASYSEDEIAYSFDCWGRNGNAWPLPKDILGIADAYRATNRQMYQRDLPSGRGVLRDNWAVLAVAFRAICHRVHQFEKAKRKYEPLSESEMDGFLQNCRDRVDKMRAK